MALGVVDLQSHLGAPLLQCKEGAAHRLWFVLQHDIICVGGTRSVCVVSGQVLEGGLQHEGEQQGPKRVPLSHSGTAKHWRLVLIGGLLPCAACCVVGRGW